MCQIGQNARFKRIWERNIFIYGRKCLCEIKNSCKIMSFCVFFKEKIIYGLKHRGGIGRLVRNHYLTT